ncbi:MAG: hypothetical protein WCL46_08805 [Chlorobium sp.]
MIGNDCTGKAFESVKGGCVFVAEAEGEVFEGGFGSAQPPVIFVYPLLNAFGSFAPGFV